jgi:hypothetical protein
MPSWTLSDSRFCVCKCDVKLGGLPLLCGKKMDPIDDANSLHKCFTAAQHLRINGYPTNRCWQLPQPVPLVLLRFDSSHRELSGWPKKVLIAVLSQHL